MNEHIYNRQTVYKSMQFTKIRENAKKSDSQPHDFLKFLLIFFAKKKKLS